MVLSHRAKFQLIINFFRVKAISTGLFVVSDLMLAIKWQMPIATLSNIEFTQDGPWLNRISAATSLFEDLK